MLPWETAPERYGELLAAKCDAVEALFAEFGAPPARRFASPMQGYRARAEFRIWHDGDALNYVMFDPAAPRIPVSLRAFPAALPPITRLMEPLRVALEAHGELRRKLFQVEFMASTAGDVLVTLVYHRPLDDVWREAATALAERFSVHLIGRSRKQKLVLSQDFIEEDFEVHSRRFRYRQYEQSFVQPNAPVNEKMLTWASEQAISLGGDLLELYCGNGNFTLPLAVYFDAVIATELSKSGTRAAKENIAANAVENVTVVRLSAEEVSAAMAGEREFRRLQALPKALDDYALSTVFVDPPRAGLDEATLACVRQFENILYVSCNPQTLRGNLQTLNASHLIESLAFFDQFPYTAHLECGVLLKRRL